MWLVRKMPGFKFRAATACRDIAARNARHNAVGRSWDA
jgi:hypothetical protein